MKVFLSNEEMVKFRCGISFYLTRPATLQIPMVYAILAPKSTNMKSTLLSSLLILLSISTTLSAQETITIGTQVWMTKNLNVDKFRNGDPIPQAKTDEEWKTAGENKQPAWCYYDNDPANGAKYGKLYNWYAVNDARGLAPAGYHVPSDAEWTILENQLGSDAATKMKSTSGWKGWETGGSKTCPNCSDWNAEYRRKVPCHVCKDSRSVPSPVVKHSGNGTNSSGFNGQAGGYRLGNGNFYDVGSYGNWWSSSEKNETNAWNRNLNYDKSNVNRNNNNKENGLSVRCLRDLLETYPRLYCRGFFLCKSIFSIIAITTSLWRSCLKHTLLAERTSGIQ